jgi:hypothetical protein
LAAADCWPIWLVGPLTWVRLRAIAQSAAPRESSPGLVLVHTEHLRLARVFLTVFVDKHFFVNLVRYNKSIWLLV